MSQATAFDRIRAIHELLSDAPKPPVLRFGATKLMPDDTAISIVRDGVIHVMASRGWWVRLDTRSLTDILSDITHSPFTRPLFGVPVFDLDASPELMDEFCRACLGGATL